jgi:non-heme chloroperoxidase
LTNLQIASRIVAGELSGRRGNWADAIRALEEAVASEDAIPYNEPPVWHHPPRQVLGALLLESGRAADAEGVYRADLERFRENGWSLFGLMKSLQAQGRLDEAASVRQRFERAWARADVTLTSSRILTVSGAREGRAALPTDSVTLPNGVALQYVERGSAQGTPVVFLHGLTDSWRSFEGVLPNLPPSMRAIALTLRGHGGSSRPETGYALGDLALDVNLFLDALGIPSAVVVGHSMGSAVAQRFAIEYPQRTRGLVLMGAFASLHGNQPVTELAGVVSQLTDPISRQFIEEFQVSTLARPIPPAFLDMAIAESEKVPAHVWKAALAGLRDGSPVDDLHRITAPTMIAWGDRDTIVSARDQQVLNQGISGSQLLVYPGAGHAFHWEEPGRFASDLTRFVNEEVN